MERMVPHRGWVVSQAKSHGIECTLRSTSSLRKVAPCGTCPKSARSKERRIGCLSGISCCAGGISSRCRLKKASYSVGSRGW